MQAFFDFVNRHYYKAVCAVLIAGVALRLFGFLYTPFFYHYRMGDEPAAYRMAMLYMTGEEKKKQGIELNYEEKRAQYLSSAYLGVDRAALAGPLQNQLLALGIKMSGTIEGAHVVTFILHCLSLILVWHGAQLLFGRRAALLTLVMAALFTWPVYYTFGMWHPHFISLVAAAVCYPLIWHLKTQKAVFAALSAFSYTLFFQFHLIGAFLFFFIIFYFIFLAEKKRLFIVGVVLGAAAAVVLVYIPYLKMELSTGFVNVRNLFDHGLFHIEVLKLFSNIVVVGSAEMSRIIFQGWQGYQEFYARYMGSVFVALPFVFLSMAIPIAGYVYIFRETFIALFRKPLRTWFTEIRGRKELWFVSGWFFIPWIAYFLRLKYHELRFVALDYPVMYAMFAVAILALYDRYKGRGAKLIAVGMTVVVVFHVALSIFLFDYGRYELRKPPHLVFSLRYFDAITRPILADLKRDGDTTYRFEMDGPTHYSGMMLGRLKDHVVDTTSGAVQYNENAKHVYRISNLPALPGYEMKREIYSVYLHRKLTDAKLK
ncbi:MAG: hypothetical protein HZC28_11540 [Spirochaetes bacterium]|nr:hypothetical protein [Spirochaetota bacterium]